MTAVFIWWGMSTYWVPSALTAEFVGAHILKTTGKLDRDGCGYFSCGTTNYEVHLLAQFYSSASDREKPVTAHVHETTIACNG